MAGSASNTLRAVLKELGWARTRLVAELRREAARSGDTLPGTESLIAMVSRWVNHHQQPSDFYRDLLARTLARPRAELFSDEAAQLELAAEAEPWLLARALEVSSVGRAALEALEEAVGEFARSYPSTAPTVLARPVLEHFRDVTRLLGSPCQWPAAQRLAVVAGHLAGLGGSLAFDLRDERKARAYFKVAVQAADDAGSPDLAAWALATRSLIPTYTGDPAAALKLLQEAQDRVRGHVSLSRLAWLAALEARAHAGLGDAAASLNTLMLADHAIEHAGPTGGRFANDFFDQPRLAGLRGTSHLLLGQPKAAQAALADVLALRDPADVKADPWPASTWPRPTSRTRRSTRPARPSPAPWPSATRTASGRSCGAPARSAPPWSRGATSRQSGIWTSSCVRCPPDRGAGPAPGRVRGYPRGDQGGASMKWTVHGRRTLYESDWVNLSLEDVELAKGRRLEHHVIRMPRQSVAVVVRDNADRVLLLWRHRFITDTWGWEVPAGWVDPGETAEEAALREVEEETGWTPGPLTELARYYAVPGISDLRFTLYQADGATHQGDPSDPSESSRVEWVPVTDVRKLIDKGQLTDGPSLMGLSMALAFPPPAE